MRGASHINRNPGALGLPLVEAGGGGGGKVPYPLQYGDNKMQAFPYPRESWL